LTSGIETDIIGVELKQTTYPKGHTTMTREKKQWEIEMEARIAEQWKLYLVFNHNDYHIHSVSAKNEEDAMAQAIKDLGEDSASVKRGIKVCLSF
jgi:hypothetical protein